ncbi:hypothetical protein SAMN05443428_10217 [Caloramator quimbayensis]|uniref:YvlB/LiaX N-terminal domain-containing protein n=1 Tax=Caloramator quimbayensis TaxID=1147123 RepID=A0A1T4WJN8_9CLOT|nr:hypothetical protein [Caloramator quimbayensis]SKA77389.1 hypothetical protein SAMN05443428_10217 [Caloramator quimbayensis]
MSDEIIRVLKMVEEGKISSEKAAEIINALKNSETLPEVKNNNQKMLRVKVLSEKGDNVNITIPVKFVKSVLKLTKKLPIEVENESLKDVDFDEIIGAIDSGLEGKIVDIKSDKGDIVEVSIE